MIRILWLPTIIVLSLSGCTLPMRAAEDAVPAPPEQWRSATVAAPIQLSHDWWRSLGSPELDGFIDQAQLQNLDISAAIARVRQAQASARIAGAPLLPEVNGIVDFARERRLGRNARVSTDDIAVGLAASYEVDFWGRNRALQDGALADVRASRFDHDTVQLTVTAGVASAWLSTVALHERLAIAGLNLDNAQRLLLVVAFRSRAGAATQLELAQQRGVVATLRRIQALLRQQAEEGRATLAQLLGSTGRVEVQEASLAGVYEPAISAGLPAELLTRRPDIARAEARLTAADANVLAARAAMLPSLTLSAALGGNADRLSSVFDNPLYSLAAGLTAPIFNAGRLSAGRDLAEARRRELLVGYRAAIVASFTDVEIALNAINGVDAQREAQVEELVQAREALRLAESRYRAGAETLLVLLDAQRTLYAAQDIAVQLKLSRLNASVALYKALGGGWQLPPDTERAAVVR